MASQSPAAKYAEKRSAVSVGRVFPPRCLPASNPSNLAMRGVQVRLIENLSAADHVAFNRENSDPAPFGVKTLWRGLVCQRK